MINTVEYIRIIDECIYKLKLLKNSLLFQKNAEKELMAQKNEKRINEIKKAISSEGVYIEKLRNEVIDMVTFIL